MHDHLRCLHVHPDRQKIRIDTTRTRSTAGGPRQGTPNTATTNHTTRRLPLGHGHPIERHLGSRQLTGMAIALARTPPVTMDERDLSDTPHGHQARGTRSSLHHTKSPRSIVAGLPNQSAVGVMLLLIVRRADSSLHGRLRESLSPSIAGVRDSCATKRILKSLLGAAVGLAKPPEDRQIDPVRLVLLARKRHPGQGVCTAVHRPRPAGSLSGERL